MGFVTWHYVGRIAAFTVLPLCLCGIVFDEGTVFHTVGQAAFIVFAILDLTGASIAILVFFEPFRFACPRCTKRSTQFGGSKREGVWLYCEKCGVTVRESGFLRLGLRYDDDKNA